MEDAMVFPMAERVLTAADNEVLQQKFVALDGARDVGAVARLERFAMNLSF
ncbi:MAG: hypothetical protein ACREN3_07240 [Gemmatimonadaceae bacterium]